MDRSRVAEELAASLRARGNDVVLIERDILQSEEALIQRCQALRNEAKVAGVVHLAASGLPALSADGSPSEWRQALRHNEKALFLMLRELSPHLVDDAHVVATSDLGGNFGRDGKRRWRAAVGRGRCRHLEVIPQGTGDAARQGDRSRSMRAADSLASDLLAEIELEGGRQEVGYPAGERTVFRTAAESSWRSAARSGIDQSGGARHRRRTRHYRRDAARTGASGQHPDPDRPQPARKRHRRKPRHWRTQHRCATISSPKCARVARSGIRKKSASASATCWHSARCARTSPI